MAVGEVGCLAVSAALVEGCWSSCAPELERGDRFGGVVVGDLAVAVLVLLLLLPALSVLLLAADEPPCCWASALVTSSPLGGIMLLWHVSKRGGLFGCLVVWCCD